MSNRRLCQVFFDGFHGDCAETFLVGDVDEMGRNLVEGAKRCRDAAIAACGPGVPMNKIGSYFFSQQLLSGLF
jgi:methionyl aminopeptidase